VVHASFSFLFECHNAHMGSEADDAIDLRVGEEYSVRLAGLGTAGYRWAADLQGDPGVADVHPAGAEALESSGAVGAAADEVFTIRANRPGAARIRFVQRRPWEKGAPASNERTIQLRVT
jgi:predicted secreted protein